MRKHKRFARDMITFSKPLPATAAPVESKATQPGPPRASATPKSVPHGLQGVFVSASPPLSLIWSRKFKSFRRSDLRGCRISLECHIGKVDGGVA